MEIINGDRVACLSALRSTGHGNSDFPSTIGASGAISFVDIDIAEGIEKRVVYSCQRFMSAREMLKTYEEMLIVDADCILRRPIDWDDFKDFHYALYFRDPLPNTNEWETAASRVAAGAVYLKREAGPYMIGVSLMISAMGYAWFVDQYALHQVHMKEAARKLPLISGQVPQKYIDWDFNDHSVFWTGKGNRKYENPDYLELRSRYGDA